MKNLHFYKPSIDQTISMMNQTYRDALSHKGGNVSIRVLPPCDVDFYDKFDLTKFNYEDDIDLYADTLTSMMTESFEKRKHLTDNMIPAFMPVLGIGDYSAFVTGDIDFRKDTSWSSPSLENIEDWKKLPEVGSSKWYKKFLVIVEALLKASKGSEIPFMRGFFSPMDLAGTLRGDKIYYDLYDSPDELGELLNFCADATIKFASDIYALAKKYLGDTKYGMWYLNNTINMSEDISCMISGEQYTEICAPHTQKVIDHFGVGHLHCHSRAMYLVKEICALKNVANLWLPTDPNAPKPIEHVEQVVEDARGTCVAIDCENFGQIENNIDKLRKGNFSVCLPVKDIAEAEATIERFNKL